MMKVSLTVLVSGPMQGKRIPITIPRFVIGRDPQCNLQPGNATISKMHCALKIAGDRILLEDLKSTPGTFVNDKQIAGEVELKNGDRFQVGPLIFGLSVEAEKPAPSPPPSPVVPENKPRLTPETGVMPASAAIAAGETAQINAKTTDTIHDKPKKEEKAKDRSATSIAAKELLKKYLRRKRDMDEPMV